MPFRGVGVHGSDSAVYNAASIPREELDTMSETSDRLLRAY
jgi:hypothetical protein